MLKVETKVFMNMLRDLLINGLIAEEQKVNIYGSNAYKATNKGDKLIDKIKNEKNKKIIDLSLNVLYVASENAIKVYSVYVNR